MTSKKLMIAVLTVLLVFIPISCSAGAWSPVWEKTYDQNRFSIFSRDYFSRFSRDPSAKPLKNEVQIDHTWKIIKPAISDPVVQQVVNDFAVFMDTRMNTKLIQSRDMKAGKRILFILKSMKSSTPGSFSIKVTRQTITLSGVDSDGLRDAVVKLVDMIGMKQAPILPVGESTYKPRLQTRLGEKPLHGSYRDVAFMGNNAAVMGYVSLYSVSTSDAIPELIPLRNASVLQELKQEVAEARTYGLRTYIHVNTPVFTKEAPVFIAHPEIRGAEVYFGKPGEYTLCSEHPLVRRYLAESVEGFLRATKADGIMIIIGGEEFYHCFMRPTGVAKGHTNCARCEPLGAEKVVADLVNTMGEAARRANPRAEVVAWPYSASSFWSSDDMQAGMIKLMKPGTALLTEIEKDEVIEKPGGVSKLLWDYSIDLTGVGKRAARQTEACKLAGIPIYLKSDHEHAYEAPRLPNIPCMDRWLDRADSLASSGADGAWVFPYFYRPFYATSSGEIGKSVWWQEEKVVLPKGNHVRVPIDKEKILQEYAYRIAGPKAGPHLRKAWHYASKAIDFSPEIAPNYFMGTYSIGPDHPMCADPDAVLSDVFYLNGVGAYDPKSNIKGIPVFDKNPTKPGSEFGRYYRSMEACLKKAVDEMHIASPLVPARCRLTFEAEDAVIRYFYHTERTQANFYESCAIRDKLLLLIKKENRTESELSVARKLYERWKIVLLDELENAEAAIHIEEIDNRLDQNTPIFPAGVAANKAKQEMLRHEINVFLPSLAVKLGIVSK